MRLYLAAYETQKQAYNVDINKDANLFLTYYYEKITNKCLPLLKPQGHKGLITIDSGAHSFFELMGISVTNAEAKTDKMQDPHQYFERYLEWAKQYHKFFDYFCELDLQELVGMPKVIEWRKRISDAGLGKKLITVYHSSDSWEDYVRLCDTSESKYIAIEGIRKGGKMLDYNKFIKHAYDRNIKIHGFAFTRSKLLEHFPFYSVDSSSWTTVPRYGVINKFQNGKMTTIKPTKETMIKSNAPVFLNNKERSKEDNKKKLEWSANEYIKMGEHFTKYWEMRGVRWKD